MEQEREKRERADREAEERKHKLKKVKKRDSEEERPLAVGAHGVARQDGVDIHKGKFYSNLLVHTHFTLSGRHGGLWEVLRPGLI